LIWSLLFSDPTVPVGYRFLLGVIEVSRVATVAVNAWTIKPVMSTRKIIVKYIC
jgi:hypothetical protein